MWGGGPEEAGSWSLMRSSGEPTLGREATLLERAEQLLHARPGREATLLEPNKEQRKAAVDWELRIKRSKASAKRARRLQKKAFFARSDSQGDLHVNETQKEAAREQPKAERTLAKLKAETQKAARKQLKAARKQLKKAQEKAQGRDESRERRRGDWQRSRRRRRGDADEDFAREKKEQQEEGEEEEEAALRRLRGGAAGNGGDDPPPRRPGVELAPAPAEAPGHAPRVDLFHWGGRGVLLEGVLLEGVLALAVLALALRHWWRRGGFAPRASALHAKRGILVATVGGSADAAPATPEAAGRKPHAAAQPRRTRERTPEPPLVSRSSPRRAGSAPFPSSSPSPVVSSSDDSGMRSAAYTAGAYPSGCSTTSALPTPPRVCGGRDSGAETPMPRPGPTWKARQPRAPPHRRGHAQRRRPAPGQRSGGESVSSSTSGEAESPQEWNPIVSGSFFIGEESDEERAAAPPRGGEGVSSSTNGDAEAPQEGNPIVPGSFFIGEESDEDRAAAPPRGREPTQGSYLIWDASDVSSSDWYDETLASAPCALEARVPSEPADASATTRGMARAVRRMLDTSAIAIVQSLLERFSRAWAEARLRERELGKFVVPGLAMMSHGVSQLPDRGEEPGPHSESGASCSEPGSARRQHTGSSSSSSSSSCAASAGEAASRRRGWRQPGGQAAEAAEAAAAASEEDAKDGANSSPRPGTPAEGGTAWERQPSASTAAPSSSDFVEASAYQVAFDDPLASPRLASDELSPRRLASGSSDPLASDDPSTEADPADAISRQATTTTGAGCHCPATSPAAPASRGSSANMRGATAQGATR